MQIKVSVTFTPATHWPRVAIYSVGFICLCGFITSDPTLKNLAQELIELLKKLVGLEKFSLAFAAVQKESSQRRASRKKHKALQVSFSGKQCLNVNCVVIVVLSWLPFVPFVSQAVANPDIAARKKIKKHQKKTEAKKRKTEFLRPGHKAKRSKRSSLRDLAMVQ